MFEKGPFHDFITMAVLVGFLLLGFFLGKSHEASRHARPDQARAAVQQPALPPAKHDPTSPSIPTQIPAEVAQPDRPPVKPEPLREVEEAANVPNFPENKPHNSPNEKTSIDSEELDHWEVLTAAWTRTRSSFRLYDHLKKNGAVSNEVLASYVHWSEFLAYQEFLFKFEPDKAATFKDFPLAKGGELWKQVTEENPARAAFLKAGRESGPFPWPIRIDLHPDRQLPPRHSLAIVYFNKAHWLVKMVEDWNDPETPKTAEEKENLEQFIESCRKDLDRIEEEVRRFEPMPDLET